jgi:FkbM family methyltransferase
MPMRNDTVIDFGAGYGEEAIYLAYHSAGVKYFGVEPQPAIYECLANTFKDSDEEYIASPYVVSNRATVRFVTQFSYASVAEVRNGYMEVPTLTWTEFLERYNIKVIDLIKMNIEGAEKELISNITDFGMIKRFVISCHDFRSKNGDGRKYRTNEFVMRHLESNGYRIRPFEYGINWADNWIFAEK